MIHKLKLDEEELDKVNGGYIYDTRTIRFDENGNGYNTYEVIDDETGAQLYVAKSYNEAVRKAEQLRVSTKEIRLSRINDLREAASGN